VIKNTFYVTTPIYYVTAKPHLGSLYSTLLADIAARWNKLMGKETFFLTGTDEHGQKVAAAAQKAGKSPQEFVDSFIPAYKDTWHKYELDYTEFIRTTDSHHVQAVQQWIKKLIISGDIYKGEYSGFYCTHCETFVTGSDHPSINSGRTGEKHTGEEQIKPVAYPACPSCGRETHALAEQTYFFRLSKYQDRLLQFYADNPDFITPKERVHEVINFVKSGLTDLSISRTTITWGIPFPGDPNHVTYVWADALNNYITAIGYGDPDKQELFNRWWPADVHVLGKDIVRFHAIYWPAFLMASNLALPKKLLVHGWITVGDQKMSKSLGNVVDPIALYEKYGAEPVRYYLMRKMAISHDSSFSIEDLEQTITADLANDLGNLLNRLTTLAQKHNLPTVTAPTTWSPAACDLRDSCSTMLAEVKNHMDDYLYHRALARIWHYIHATNTFFHAHEPWKLANTDPVAFAEIISATCHSLQAIAIMLLPIMPTKMHQLLESIGALDATHHTQTIVKNLEDNVWRQTFMLKKIDPLFEKFDPSIHFSGNPKNTQDDRANSSTHSTPVRPEFIEGDKSYITIDDFVKIELVVGTITHCEPAPNSTKLLVLNVDFGPLGTRTILSGIAQWYAPQDLITKQGIFVLNLKPRKMAGLESQGMMLSAKTEDGNLKMATVASPVPNGIRLS